MVDLLPIERDLLDVLLAGGDPVLETLRAQSRASLVARRESTGSGTFTYFSVPPDVPLVSPPSLRIGDVMFSLRANESGGEAILWVKGGVLDALELYARDGTWPPDAQLDGIGYFGGERDVASLRQSWGG